MYDYRRQEGESCYRLINRSGEFIYLKTRGFLEVEEQTNQVRSFICVNTLVSNDEGRRLIREMKRRFAVLINQAAMLDQENDTPAVEEPQNLERAIRNLITNLDVPTDDPGGHRMDESESVGSNDSNDSHSNHSRPCSVKPTLALVAPSAEDIRPAVVKSLENVITVSKGAVRPKAMPSGVVRPQSQQQRPSVLQKHTSSPSPQYSQSRLSIESPISSPTHPNSNGRSRTSSSSSHSNSVLKRPAESQGPSNGSVAKRRNVIQSCGSLSPCLSQLSDPETSETLDFE